MTADPTKKRIVLVVHGVQAGTDEGLTSHKDIQKLIRSRLGGTALNYGVDLYAYENISDKTLKPFIQLSKVIIKSPVASALAKPVIDIVGDVVISLAQGTTADAIRKGLRSKILGYYESGNPLYIVAHSLGSIYAFDVINELMNDTAYYDRNDRSSWPVQGLLTIGSPIGLKMFKLTGRDDASDLGPGARFFHWMNYFDVNDPVVSGNLFGATINTDKIAELYKTKRKEQGWHIRDIKVDTGKAWIAAHTGYWKTSAIGDGLIDMMI